MVWAFRKFFAIAKHARCAGQNGLMFIGDFGIGKKRALSSAGAPGLRDQQIPFGQAEEIDR